MITVTDFIRILLHFFEQSKAKMLSELGRHTIRDWRDILSKISGNTYQKQPRLISCSPEDSLFHAGRLLVQNRIHRLPVIDADNVLHIMTHHELLSYVYGKVMPVCVYVYVFMFMFLIFFCLLLLK